MTLAILIIQLQQKIIIRINSLFNFLKDLPKIKKVFHIIFHQMKLQLI